MYTDIYMYIHTYICVYLCTQIYVCVHIYTHIYIQIWSVKCKGYGLGVGVKVWAEAYQSCSEGFQGAGVEV